MRTNEILTGIVRKLERFFYFLHRPMLLFRIIVRTIELGFKKCKKARDVFKGVIYDYDFTQSVTQTMYLGLYEPEETEFLKSELKRGETFIDIGGNIGYFSLIGAGCVGKNGEVHVFEPMPEYYSVLESFAKKNAEFKIFINHCAVGDVNGSITIHAPSGKNWGGSAVSAVPGLTKNIGKSIEVPIITIDSYVKEKGLRNVSFVKIDVEGYELPVLKGMRTLLTLQKPIVLCEVSPAAYPLLGCSVGDIFRFMEDLGYTAYLLKDFRLKKITTWNFDKNINVVFKHTRVHQK